MALSTAEVNSCSQACLLFVLHTFCDSFSCDVSHVLVPHVLCFAGQYGMVLLSRFPIDAPAARTFQNFLTKDMPGALLPTDPKTGQPWYSTEDLEVCGGSVYRGPCGGR